MQRAYKSAEREIERRLKEVERLIATAAAENAEARVSWLVNQERYRALLEQVYRSTDQFSLSAEEVAKKQQRTNAERGTGHARELAKVEFQGAGVRLPQSFSLLNTEAINSMVGVLRDGSPLRTLFASISPKALNVAREVMTAGIAAGDNPRLIGRKMAQEVKKLSLERAVTIARNESLRVYTDAQQRTYQVNSDVVLRSRIVSALDARTCPICWARHGTFVEHGDPFYRHVCCRCSLAPVTRWTPQRLSGEEVLRTRPEAFQRQILGPERYELWKSGQIQLGDIAVNSLHPKWGAQVRLRRLDSLRSLSRPGVVSGGGRSEAVFKETTAYRKTPFGEVPDRIRNKPREQLVLFDEKKRWITTSEGDAINAGIPPVRVQELQSLTPGGYAVHNHPNGGPISFEDLAFTRDFGLAEHRVVTRDVDYIIKGASVDVMRLERVRLEFREEYLRLYSEATAMGLSRRALDAEVRRRVHEWYRLLGIDITEEVVKGA